MTYPLSSEVTAGQPTAAAHYNNLRADALRFGQAEADTVRLGQFLGRFAAGVRINYLATNRLRVPYSASAPATLMINGCMCQLNANADLPGGQFSGGAATWYVFARRNPGSTGFTLEVNTSASVAPDQRIIGEVNWDGSNIISVRTYFESALAAPDYDSGWFAAAYNNSYTKAHGLSQVPRLVLVEHSATSGGTGEIVALLVSLGTDFKSVLGYDASNVYLTFQNNSSYGVIMSTRRGSGGGYVHIMAWR
jgi:hypothetical protein